MSTSLAHLAAIDLDGTILDGQSQRMFMRYLVRRRMAPLSLLIYVFGIFLLYGLGRKLDLSALQKRVVATFRGFDDARLQALFDDFTAIEVAGRIRPEARREIGALVDQGVHVVIVSGSIAPLVARAGALVGIDHIVATKIAPSRDGRNSGLVEGEMLAGKAKVEAIRAHADFVHGPGRWVLWRAYGDHETDIELLSAADEAIAVCPTPGLETVARARAWRVLNWA